MAQHDFETAVQTIDRLTPDEKRTLLAYLARSLHDRAHDVALPQHQAALERLRQDLAALPVENPVDGFSNRQHDQLLYGAP